MKKKYDPCRFEKCPKKEKCIDYEMSCQWCKLYKAYLMGVEDGEAIIKEKIADATKEANNLKDTIKRMSNTIEEMQEVIDYFNEQYNGRQ